ncbi:unnamed protein product [Cuscuta epithymum]|nr:unnamed protein product [Cuscuta epithymum]
MIEGTAENLSVAVESNCDPPDHDSLLSRKSDGGDTLTDYSSCESEYERYCSANSATGTPTVYSSLVTTSFLEFPHSFKIGDEHLNGWNNGSYRKLPESRYPGHYLHENEFCYQKIEAEKELVEAKGETDLYENADLFLMHDDSSIERLDICAGSGVKFEDLPVRNAEEEEKSHIHGSEEDMNMVVVVKEVKNSGSSRNSHSEDDYSIFGGETDAEDKIELYYSSNLPPLSQKHSDHDKKFCMNSSIAFGSDDWDDFVQETKSVVLLAQDDFQADSNQNFEVKSGCLPNASKMPIKFSGVSSKVQQDEANRVLVTNKPKHTSPLEHSDLLKNCKGEHPKVLHTQNNQSYVVDAFSKFLKESSVQNVLRKNRDGISGQSHQCDISEEEIQTNSSSMDSKIKTLYVEPHLVSVSGEHSEEAKTMNLDLNGLYSEIVHDMEEILLDSGEPSGFALGNKIYQSYIPLLSRDGGTTASICSRDDASPINQHPWRIRGIEVIGARQRKGNVSLSERILGIKEHTLYKIRVWSGEENWDVERRFRDFSTLYHHLKKAFADQGWVLPPPWSSIERESIKLFCSASPDVIAERSVLIQECLQSTLHSRFPSASLNPLFGFLSPAHDIPNPLKSDSNITFGKTISLIVQNRPFKSVKQLLDEQHHSCAGCYINFGGGKSRVEEFVQTLGWGRPRLCEYSGQLYCSSCHRNETAVLPARVLHYWDFSYYSVSQMAKSYLESIYSQPMLCVSAVNPVLFSKVLTLQRVTNMRKRIGVMLPFVRCSFRGSIFKAVGSRRYLLESSDFFALKDLIDLSKGVFSALPVMVETISRKIVEHIAEQCLICCDVGIPCNARQHCDDLSSLIFPFQEGEIERCKSCNSVFHKKCFKKTPTCPCGSHLNPGPESNGGGIVGNKSKHFLSALFPKVRSPRPSHNRDQDTVILMGSLPSNTL